MLNNYSSHPSDRPSLPPSIAYYLRKLLRQNLDRLRFSNLVEGVPPSDPVSDLDGVLAYLYPEAADVMTLIPELERMVSYHQALARQGSLHHREIDKVNQRMFEMLGFEVLEVTKQGSILLVDDTPNNLMVLSDHLTAQGYDVRSAINGRLALIGAQNTHPDLILLDVVMPGMDGYEVCQKLKADDRTRDIPVIFISAIDEVVDKVRAFDVGAVDYITKPFQIQEVLARIENQLKIRNLQKRLEEQNIRQQQELRERIAANEALRQEQERSQVLLREIQIEQQKSERLLRSILPSTIANRLKQQSDPFNSLNGEATLVEQFDEVTVLFADLAGFSRLANQLPPLQLVGLLSRIFAAFDFLCEERGLEKVKTHGDVYLVAGGLHQPRADHAVAIADLALAMHQVIAECREFENQDLALEIGIHTGPVIAGVIGSQKITYDVWGDTVNVAYYMQASGQADRTQISEVTYPLIKDHFHLEERGTMSVKGRGEMKTYWLWRIRDN